MGTGLGMVLGAGGVRGVVDAGGIGTGFGGGSGAGGIGLPGGAGIGAGGIGCGSSGTGVSMSVRVRMARLAATRRVPQILSLYHSNTDANLSCATKVGAVRFGLSPGF